MPKLGHSSTLMGVLEFAAHSQTLSVARGFLVLVLNLGWTNIQDIPNAFTSVVSGRICCVTIEDDCDRSPYG